MYRIAEYMPEAGEIVDLQRKVYTKLSVAKGVVSRIIGDRCNEARHLNKDELRLYRQALHERIFIQETEVNWVKVGRSVRLTTTP